MVEIFDTGEAIQSYVTERINDKPDLRHILSIQPC